MILDLESAAPTDMPPYDLCIVGSGPAGMTIAHELFSSGLRIAVLESGRARRTSAMQALCAVESDGIAITDASRECVLGGASTTWSGVTSVLDQVDVAPRPWAGLRGWPIDYAELLRFDAEAAERYGFPRPEQYEARAADIRRTDLDLPWGAIVEKQFLVWKKPLNFGEAFHHIFRSSTCDLYLDATVVRLERQDEGSENQRTSSSHICSARVRTSAQRELVLSARVFVLACGGIENARLLLLSRGLSPAGLGNEHDQVGRCFMNHPKGYFGLVRLHRPVGHLPYFRRSVNGEYFGYRALRLTDDEQRRRAVLNAHVRLEPLYPWSQEGSTPAARVLASLRAPRQAIVEFRQRIAAGYPPRTNLLRVRNFLEMAPAPANRVMLGSALDRYGQPVPFVRHRPTPLDCRSAVELQEALRQELERHALGVLEGDLATAAPWPINQDASSHHMGSTRMGTDPEASVVNADLRLHDVDNVYCAGASTFPTSGSANPMLTIVALSIRLAGHLRTQLSPRIPQGVLTE